MTLATLKTWDREAYYRMGEQGYFGPDERVELIEGVITRLSPQNKKHAALTTHLTMVCTDLFRSSHVVRVQLPLDLGNSQPEPDLAIVTIEEEEVCPLHPRSADLLIEVADSSVAFDRIEKASLYARYGFPELWIVLVQDRRVEVCRQPIPDPDTPFGFNYAYRVKVEAGQAIAPLFAPTQFVQAFPPPKPI